MVAIYLNPHPAEMDQYIIQAYKTAKKFAFIDRALNLRNTSKDNRITCLGVAVTYNRRCRNRIHHSTAVITELVEAAEDGTLQGEDLEDMAVQWGARLSCYLHGAQKGPGMAVLGAIALYRATFPDNVQMPRVQMPLRLSAKGLSGGDDDHAQPRVTDKQADDTKVKTEQETKITELEAAFEKKLVDLEARFEAKLNDLKIKHEQEMRELVMVLQPIRALLVSMDESILLVRENQKLITQGLTVLLEEQMSPTAVGK